MDARAFHLVNWPRIEDVQMNILMGAGSGLQVRPHDVVSIAANPVQEPRLSRRACRHDTVKHADQWREAYTTADQNHGAVVLRDVDCECTGRCFRLDAIADGKPVVQLGRYEAGCG